MISLPRHLAYAAALALGEAAGIFLSPFSAMWPLAALAVAFSVLFGYGRAVRGWTFAATAALGLALALFACDRRNGVFDAAEHERGPFVAEVSVEGNVSESRSSAGERWASFNSSVGGVAVKAVVPLAPGAEAPRVGERWRIGGWMDSKSRGSFRRRTVWVKGKGTFAERISPASPADRLLAGVRGELSRRVGIGLKGERTVADLHRAILLGERSRLPAATRNTFVGAGTVHIFAISGLHVMVVAQAIFILFALFAVPYRFVGLALAPFLWGYAWLIGMPPSAVRAVAMASVYYLAPLFWRRSDALVAWSVVFLAFHALDPLMLANVGSLLSFSVMLGILLFLRWMKAVGWTRFQALGVTLAAWAAGVPIAAMVFGRVTPGGILANLLLVPLAALDVVAVAAGVALSFVLTPLAAFANNVAALFTRAMQGVSWAVSRLPGANLESVGWTWWDTFAWYAVIVLALWLVQSVVRRRRRSL